MPARDLVLVLLGCTACGGSATLADVEVSASAGDGDCIEREDDDSAPRCLGIAFGDFRAVDVLFVIDDGPDAGALQLRLATAMDELAASVGAMDPQPDLRIGFTSSRDANPSCGGGTGRVVLSSCRERPEDFITAEGVDRFAELCAANCTVDELATAQPWIERFEAETNLASGTALADALRCASVLGVAGCAFPAPIAAMRSAILRSEQDLDAGEDAFFRPHATPILVWVTSGAECSLGPAGLEAFDAAEARSLWSDPEVATVGLCWNAGTECTEPDDAGAMSCTASDIDVEGRATGPDNAVLQPLAELALVLGEVAARDSRTEGVLMFAITGVPADLVDGSPPAFAPEDESTAARYGVQPTCMIDDDAMLPPIRLAALHEVTPNDFSPPELLSACTDDFAPALARVADAIGSTLHPTCMPACVADVDPDMNGLQVDCTVTVRAPRPEDGVDEFSLARCAPSASGNPTVPPGERGCFTTRTGDAMHDECIDSGWNLEFEFLWDGPRPLGLLYIPSCELSDDKDSDCPDL